MENHKKVKPLRSLTPGQRYWTFNPAFGKNAKIRFDIVRTVKDNKMFKSDLIQKCGNVHERIECIKKIMVRQRMELALGLCFESEEDAKYAKEHYFKS